MSFTLRVDAQFARMLKQLQVDAAQRGEIASKSDIIRALVAEAWEKGPKRK